MNWVVEQAEAYLSLFLVPYSLFLTSYFTCRVTLLYVVESHRAPRDKHIYIFPAKYCAAPPRHATVSLNQSLNRIVVSLLH